jgi:hypothetical protein
MAGASNQNKLGSKSHRANPQQQHLFMHISDTCSAPTRQGLSLLPSLATSIHRLTVHHSHLHGLAVADEQAGAAEAAVSAMAAAAVCLADAVCGGAAAAATRAVLLATELLLAAEVAGDACGKRSEDNKQETGLIE